MEVSTDPGSPQLRSATKRPLTMAEWSTLRPFITYTYKKKQLTARTILEELNRRGFDVTSKMLRTRLKAWGIDDKNRRKDKRPSFEHHERHRRASHLCENARDRCTVPAKSGTTTVDHDSGINEDVEPYVDNVCTLPRTQGPHDTSPAFRHRVMPQSLTCAQDLQSQRLLGAINNWYDHLSTHAQPLEVWSGDEVFRRLDQGMDLVLNDVQAGRNLLQEAGPEVPTILRSTDPTLLARLLYCLIGWQCRGAGHLLYRQHASIVGMFLTRTSYFHLGATHPVTILVETFVHQEIPPDVCDTLFKAIELNHVQKIKDDGRTRFKITFHIFFGALLLTQGRCNDVEDWFESYLENRTSISTTAWDDVCALIILVESRISQRRYSEANEAISQAMVCLAENSLYYSNVACSILSLSAKVKWLTGDMTTCEELHHECVRVAETIDDDLQLMCALSALRNFYIKCGSSDMAFLLSEAYPNFLGE